MADFFEERKNQSKIKTEIITKYFHAWAKIIAKRAQKVAYIDLFSGPGRYEDGNKSTPLIILEQCIQSEELRQKAVTIFNDLKEEFSQNLENEVKKLDGIHLLKHSPVILNQAVDEELTKYFNQNNLVPTFAFIDPFGYKGLSEKLISGLTKDWGSDCVFFFNYNRISMGIPNKFVKQHMDAIFGTERTEKLREHLKGMTPAEKELTIVNELADALSNNQKNFVLPFRFIQEGKNRTSHYLIFVSKNVLGYSIMKEIMWRSSSEHNDGVANFSFIPIKDEESGEKIDEGIAEQLTLLLQYTTPLDELGEELMKVFSGKTLTLKKIFNSHHVGTPFILSNYQETLRRLEADGRIITDPPAAKRRNYKGVKTFSENVLVTFP